ncbi:Matrixin, partial [Teladorsagia circumcincta]
MWRLVTVSALLQECPVISVMWGASSNELSHLDTKKKMAEPRCGVTDVLAVTTGGAAFKWKKNRLTYSIENFSPDLPREDVKRAIREGYDVWAAVTPLEFEEVQPGSGADIKVRFGTGNHNDPWPFDGQGLFPDRFRFVEAFEQKDPYKNHRKLLRFS